MGKTGARVLSPNRKQMEFRVSDLESLPAEYRGGKQRTADSGTAPALAG